MTSQKNGPTMTTAEDEDDGARRDGAARRRALRGRGSGLARGSRVASSAIVHPLRLEPELTGRSARGSDEETKTIAAA